MKVYVCTSGDYSDFKIEGIFSTKEKAEEYYNFFKDLNDIEEWELDNFGFDKFKGSQFYKVTVDLEGNKKNIEVTKSCSCDFPENRYSLYNENRDDATKERFGYGYCWAKDEEHALKIINEQRAQYIAGNFRDRDTQCQIQADIRLAEYQEKHKGFKFIKDTDNELNVSGHITMKRVPIDTKE